MNLNSTNASELQFGPEFTPPEPLTAEMIEGKSEAQIARLQGERAKRDVNFMMNDEVMVLLSSVVKQNEDQNDTAKNTLNYLQKIGGFAENNKLQNVVDNIRGQLASEQYNTKDQMQRYLHPFEIAQLSNLVVTEIGVDEAVTWIPSLGNIEETALTRILENLAECKDELQ